MIDRRKFLYGTASGLGSTFLTTTAAPNTFQFSLTTKDTTSGGTTPSRNPNHFPYYQSAPVSYLNVQLQDTLWAPRQRVIRDVTVPWATRHFDAAGGLDAFNKQPSSYQSRTEAGDVEALKFIEAMAAAVGLQRDPSIEGLIDVWAKDWINGQGADGYLQAGFSAGTVFHPAERWKFSPLSHETYLIGHYIEAAIGLREATGQTALYDSAIRAVDNMISALVDIDRPYTSGHPEIEQALMRLYGVTGEPKHLRLCEWILAQRGHHEGRTSGGKIFQDHLPVKDQRTIEGHAVMAAYLFNGVTQYVGATGDKAYRDVVLSVWEDLVERKLYLHGGSGNTSTGFEGYKSEPYAIPPDDTYGESCAVIGAFQWAHNLFSLTGDAKYLDTAERMLYNAIYASLSLNGDRYFYRNVSQSSDPVLRYEWHSVPCCPPNIVKLFSKVGGFFYATDDQGIFVKHYGASEADIPFGPGIHLIQRGNYPWSGELTIQVMPKSPCLFTLRLRVPAWARSHTVSVNGRSIQGEVKRGWLTLRRRWMSGDRVELQLAMTIERITMPPQFKDYSKLVALQRGPIIYCLEQQDADSTIGPSSWLWLYLPSDIPLSAQHRPDLLGGVTVLKANLPQANFFNANTTPVPALFVPYGTWNNRTPSAMSIWLPIEPRMTLEKMEEFFASRALQEPSTTPEEQGCACCVNK